MMTNIVLRLMATFMFGCVLAVAAHAADNAQRFFGNWKIESGDPAPWVTNAAKEVDRAEVKRLLAARVVFGAHRVEGPAPLACKPSGYEIKDTTAEGLFEGGLDEMTHGKGARAAAAKIGFTRDNIPTLAPACESEVAYHAIDDDHLIFALNNTLYRMTRMSAAPVRSK